MPFHDFDIRQSISIVFQLNSKRFTKEEKKHVLCPWLCLWCSLSVECCSLSCLSKFNSSFIVSFKRRNHISFLCLTLEKHLSLLSQVSTQMLLFPSSLRRYSIPRLDLICTPNTLHYPPELGEGSWHLYSTGSPARSPGFKFWLCNFLIFDFE